MFTHKASAATENSVELDNTGVIWLRYRGPQTRATLRTLTERLFKLMAQQRAAGKKVYIISDMRHISRADSSARLEAKWFLEEAAYDALAIVGNRYLRPFIFFVLRDFKSRKSVEYFSNEQAALKWLNFSNHHTDVGRIKPRNLLKWAIVPLILLMLGGTYLSWQQAKERLDTEADKQFAATVQTSTEAIKDRMQIYLRALYGFRGLFHASDDVSEREYHDYFAALDLVENYPGFNSINFVANVREKDLPAFLTKVRTDRSWNPGGNPDFTITPDTNRPEHYVVTFVGIEGVGSGKGVNLASSDERRATLEAARDSGEPTATPTINLFNQKGQEQAAVTGFLVTIPVYRQDVPGSVAERRATNEGFVNAVFDYKNLFDHIFGSTDVEVAIRLTDSAGTVMYERGIAGENTRKTTISLPIAGQTWTMEFRAPRLFGVSANEAYLPSIIAILGLLITAFLAVAFLLQNRSRQRAIDLASAMTEDIKEERNIAVAVKNKDEAILSSIGDAVLVLDTTGNIILFNKAAELISGFSAQEAVGQPYKQILHFYNEKDGTPADSFIAAALSGKKAEMARFTMLRRKDGVTRPVADSAAPVYDAEGSLLGAVIVFRDITRERQLEHMKDEFLSVASHELRTPMGAVRANVAMILDGDYGPVNKELVEPLTDIKASTVRLVELVNDLLNVARIEAGRMQFKLGEFDVREAVRGVVSNLAPLGKEKGVAISLTPGSAVTVQGDPDKIKQVLTNLVGNALKFTDKGSITVGISSKKELLEVEVSDTGIGIASDDQKKLFAKFEQIVSAQNGKPAGTGLGLYISRQMIRKMGGELWIKTSRPGKGSVFAFTVPLAGSTAAAKAKQLIQLEAAQHPDQK